MTLLPTRRRMRPRPDTFERWHTVDGRPTCTRSTWIEPYPRVPDDPRRALNPLMRFAAQVWANFVWILGGPRAMLRARAIATADWRYACDRIFHLEELVRRILLIAALTMNVTLRPASGSHARSALRKPKRENANSPRTWRVSFRSMPATLEGVPPRAKVYPRNPRSRPLAVRNTRGLARRMEALIRAITHGRVHARRLAFRMAQIEARNARSNQPRLLGLRHWDFHPLARTPGKHAVNTGMQKAALLSVRVLTRWNMRAERPEPG